MIGRGVGIVIGYKIAYALDKLEFRPMTSRCKKFPSLVGDDELQNLKWFGGVLYFCVYEMIRFLV